MGSCACNIPSEHTVHSTNNRNVEMSTANIQNPSQKIKDNSVSEELFNNPDFSLLIFQTDSGKICSLPYTSKTCINENVVLECIRVNRLISCLKYYESLAIITNKMDHNLFRQFMKNTYDTFVDDYVHLVNKHGEHLQDINKLLTESTQFKKCDAAKCVFTARHNQDDSKTDESVSMQDATLTFYKEAMDSLHFYVFHLYHCGLRISNHEVKSNDTTDVALHDDELFDSEFDKLNKIIKKSKTITNSFSRFKNNEKFCLFYESKTVGMQKATTYIDKMLHSLQITADQNKMHHSKSIHDFIQQENYDTDSVQFDVLNNVGNISSVSDNEYHMKIITHFVKTSKIKTSSFQVGYTFYYWPHYRHMQKLDHYRVSNINDHGGYLICDLFVTRKYASFQEEILNYTQFDKTQYDYMVSKATQYISSQIVRETKAKYITDEWAVKLEYEIYEETVLSLNNLISVILYTDFSKLSSDFSASFRSKSLFEPLSSIKARNENYYWWSRILRETVQIFGETIFDDLKGPFYCGLKYEMVFPEFDIRLCSPTSTSVSITVATQFAGRDGMVVQLNNTVQEHMWLHGFNCSWLSKYKEENERFFFGGLYRMQIESVRIMRTKLNYGLFFAALSKFNRLINGLYTETNDISDEEVDIISVLMHSKLKTLDDKKFEYIYKTFEAFCQYKSQIVLNLPFLDRSDKRLSTIVVDDKNIVQKELLQKFINIRKIIIVSTNSEGFFGQEFCLKDLLTLIETKDIDEIVIKAGHAYMRGRRTSQLTWLSELWKEKQTELMEICNKYNYQIEFKNTKNERRYSEHCIEITQI